MHTLEIPESGTKITLPSCWEECSDADLRFILPLAFQAASGALDIDEFTLIVFVHFTKLKRTVKSVFLRKTNTRSASEINANLIMLSKNLCGWPFAEISTKDGTFEELSIQTVKNLLPKIGDLIGPADLLSDLKFSEFRSALREMDLHISLAKDPAYQVESLEALDRLIAILYTPADHTNKRSVADSDLTHLRKVKKMSSWQKNTILLWFSFCIKYIQTGDLDLDGKTINLSPIFPQSSGEAQGADNGIGWAGLLFDLSKEGPFGKAKETDSAGLFDVLLYLYKNHLDNIKLQKRLNKK